MVVGCLGLFVGLISYIGIGWGKDFMLVLLVFLVYGFVFIL